MLTSLRDYGGSVWLAFWNASQDSHLLEQYSKACLRGRRPRTRIRLALWSVGVAHRDCASKVNPLPNHRLSIECCPEFSACRSTIRDQPRRFCCWKWRFVRSSS